MRRLFATAGLAIAACACGLLFPGAASARQAAHTITVTGALLGTTTKGTYVQFFSGNGLYVTGPSFKEISLSGGSNFHFSWASAGPCKLTPTNGGVSCDFIRFGEPPSRFFVNTLISGTLPTSVAGRVVYADDTTGTFTAPVTEGPPDTYSFGSLRAVVKGTSIQIRARSALPPILQFSLSSGSNWHATAMSSTAGGSCGLTASNGGGSCAFATPAYDFVLNVTFRGRPPTSLRGQLTYADNTTLPLIYRFPCNCTKLSTEFTGFKTESHGDKFVFFLKWKLDCSSGALASCVGFINLNRPKLPPGLELRQGPGAKLWPPRKTRIKVQCERFPKCGPTVEGEYPFELVGLAAVRAQKTIGFLAGIYCGAILRNKRTEVSTLVFDRNGDLNRHKSHLGKLR